MARLMPSAPACWSCSYVIGAVATFLYNFITMSAGAGWQILMGAAERLLSALIWPVYWLMRAFWNLSYAFGM